MFYKNIRTFKKKCLRNFNAPIFFIYLHCNLSFLRSKKPHMSKMEVYNFIILFTTFSTHMKQKLIEIIFSCIHRYTGLIPFIFLF